MNAAKLLNLAPMLIMVAFLAYSGYSIQTSAGDPDASPSALTKELDTVAQDILTAGNAMESRLAGALRDPFQVVLKPDALAAATQSENAGPRDADVLAEIVQGLKLDATFLQGRDQMAIINGRVYSKGQQLLLDIDPDTSSSTLIVVNVLPSKVILRGGGKNYVLGYPDQLGGRSNRGRGAGPGESQQEAMAEIDPGGQAAMFQKLLNSPLGALGKGLIGNPAGSNSRSGSSRRPRGSRPAN